MPAIISRPIPAAVLLSMVLVSRASIGEDAASPYVAGSHPVETLSLEWHDDPRDRDVPVKIYLPKDVEKPAPVIIFSHGLGGSRNGYAYLGQQWASRGYVSVHLQHIGSDDSIFRGGEGAGGLQKAAPNPMNSINRPKDVSSALNRLEQANKDDGPLKGRLDLAHVGMAGHSFGAFTTMAVIGQRFSTVSNAQLS